MAVSATPGKADPKVLAQVADLSITANTTIVTPTASSRGARVTSMVVVNKTAAAVTFTLKHKNSAAAYFTICNAITIPPNGQPVCIVGKVAGALMSEIYLMGGATQDLLTGNAGTASALDVNVYGVEFDT